MLTWSAFSEGCPGTDAAVDTAETLRKVPPAIDADYEIMKDWVACAQVAEGFLAPPLDISLVPSANQPASRKPRKLPSWQD